MGCFNLCEFPKKGIFLLKSCYFFWVKNIKFYLHNFLFILLLHFYKFNISTELSTDFGRI